MIVGWVFDTDEFSHDQVMNDQSDDDSVIKMEGDSDDDTSSGGPTSVLRSLQLESENRDSPNSSMTSVSVASSVPEQKAKATLKTEDKHEPQNNVSPYMFLK